MRETTIRRINIVYISAYSLMFALALIWNWILEGNTILPLVVLGYYALTGFIFGAIECGFLIWFYLKQRKIKYLVWLALGAFYAIGSIYITCFQDYAL